MSNYSEYLEEKHMNYDVERWGMEYERGEWDIAPDPEGAYVLLAEAKAAINAARRDMLAKCIAAVDEAETADEAIAALRFLSANADRGSSEASPSLPMVAAWLQRHNEMPNVHDHGKD